MSDSNSTIVFPAHDTKHLKTLVYPFRNSIFYLFQLDDGTTNGTTLWLGAQVLSFYLAAFTPKSSHNPPKAIELGSGVGLTALVLASLGWDVVATDVPNVIDSVLRKNILHNLSNLPDLSGSIQVRELDWTVPPELWSWDDPVAIATQNRSTLPDADSRPLLSPPFDLVVTSDTLYIPSLAQPLIRTLHHLCSVSSSRSPLALVCIERRDPQLINRTLSEATEHWGFIRTRIPSKKLTKAMKKGGAKWDKKEREGVEIWKLKPQSSVSSVIGHGEFVREP